MKRFSLFIALLMAACTQPSYPGIDAPSGGGNTTEDQGIIDYIDQRLENEYYWLDEVATKVNTFNRRQPWNSYLSSTLGLLESNADDGYVNGKGQRVFYSYIREYNSSTRGTVTGFGIGLHYTIVVIDKESGHYGILVDNVYPNSPAAEAGIKRGDIITMINNGPITPNNYSTLFLNIENSTVADIKLTLLRQTTKESLSVELTRASFDESPIAYCDIIEVDNTKIGYIVYLSFVAEYDDQLLEALQQLMAEGAEELILDLRINGGGSVQSAVTLCSAMMPAAMEGKRLCYIERNPKNSSSDRMSEFRLNGAGSALELDNLTVICSGYSASASELVIMGLRGLDVPVTLIGSTTEGKNCGMDVTRRTIGSITVEYAPITFMCFNDKGFGGWGEGITPDIELTAEDNEMGVSDKNYPLPRADWGDHTHDIALAAALASVTNRDIGVTTRATMPMVFDANIPLPRPAKGTTLLREE